jgi:hypothetical protein
MGWREELLVLQVESLQVELTPALLEKGVPLI